MGNPPFLNEQCDLGLARPRSAAVRRHSPGRRRDIGMLHTDTGNVLRARLVAWLSGATLSLCCATASAMDLANVIADSISAHPEIKEKIHVYRQVLGDRAIAESGWRPSVDLEATTGLYETESPATNNDSIDYDSTTVELSLTQNLFNGYDTTYQVEQARARIDAALYDVYDTADNIALEAAQAFFEVMKQRRFFLLAQENVAAHEDILSKIRERNQSGVGRRSELQQTEGRLARARASLIAQQNNLEDAATRLHQILGRYVDPQRLREPELPSRPARTLDELIDQALVDHPAMQVASSNIKAAQADHLRSLRTRYPNVDLRLATEYGEDIDGLEGNTEETSVVLNLTYNLYRGGRDRAVQQQKVSAVYEQKEFAARVRRQVINTLRLSWTADDLLARQLVYLQDHVTKSGQTVESYKEEFFIGQRDLLDLLDAESEFNTSKNQFAEARYDALAARYRVYEGIGRLFESAGIDVELAAGRLTIARLDTAKNDELPIPDDEDADREIDPMDHCDNSLSKAVVNTYGCATVDATDVVENSSPVVGNDEFEVDSGGVLTITRTQLLANDIDADADELEIVDVGQPISGQLAFNDSGDLVYRPVDGFSGVDSFKYTVTDNHTGNVLGTARIRVREIENIDLGKTHLVNFNYNSTELTTKSRDRVNAIIDKVRHNDEILVEIYTYTDSIGSEEYNIRLSQRRAVAMKNLLIEHGIASDNIVAVGIGEKLPIADNSTAAGQAINRRGEFVFRSKLATE